MGNTQSATDTPVEVDDADDGMVKPLFKNGQYKNPFDTYSEPSFGKLFNFIFRAKDNSEIPYNNTEVFIELW